MAGMKLEVGVDLSNFRKDISFINKELTTVAGQKYFINIDFSTAIKGASTATKKIRQELVAAQGELKEAMENVSGILYTKKNGTIGTVQDIKTAISAMSQLNKELKRAKKAGDTIKINGLSNDIAAINEYRNALKRASDAAARAGLATTPANTAQMKLERANIDAQIKALEKKRALQNANPNLSNLTRLQNEIRLQQQLVNLLQKKAATYTGTSKSNTAALNAAQKELETLRAREALLRGSLNNQGRLLSRLKTLATNYVGVFGVANFVKKMIEVTGYFERQQVALQGILNSASAAQDTINRLKSMALESPFEFKDLVGYTKQLSAYGLEQEKLLPVTKQLADLSAGLGVDMNRLILAYGQVKSASVLRGQELRQFTEAGIPMVDALAKKFTELNGRLVTTGEVFELISSRKVPFEMVASVLSDMTNEGGRFYKMQENITDTLYGQVQKLKDLWTISLNDVGSEISNVLRGFVSLLQGIVKNILPIMVTIGGMAGGSILKLFVKEFNAIKTAIISIKAAFNTFITQIKAATTAAGKLRIIVSGIGKALTSNLVITALSAIVGLIVNATQKAKEFSRSLEKIEVSFAKDTAKYIQGLDSLLGKLSSLSEGTKEYNKTLDALKTNYGEFINPAIIDQLISERKQLDDTAEGWGVLRDSIVAAIQAKKDYEKHESKKEEAGNAAVENAKSLKGIFGTELRAQINKYNNAKTANAEFSISSNNAYDAELAYFNNIYSGIKSNNVQSAYAAALGAFFANDSSTKEELEKEIRDSFIRNGVQDNVRQYILENIDKIWEDLSDTKYFKEYMAQRGYLENDPRHLIDERFEEAQRTTAGRQEGRWVAGMSNADYNPAKLAHAGDYDLAVAAKDLVEKFNQSIQDKRNAGAADSTLFVGEKGLENYQAALEAFNQQVVDMSVDSFEAADKTKAISDAMHTLTNTIRDGDLHSLLTKIQEDFTNLAGVKTGRAASISTAIEKDFLSGDLDHKTKDIYKKYVPTDATIDELRNSIKKEYDNLSSTIKSYGDTQGNSANKEYVDSLKKELRILETLAGEKYFDIDLSKKTGGRSYALQNELSEFINRLKKAYETYRNSVQKGGVEFGLGYVRNDEQVKNMFGEFFGGANSELFKKLNDLKVGNKTAGSILQDKFITQGLENGILDFEEAAKSLAEELMEYYKGDKHHREAFKNASDQLLKWVETTIAKDNLSRALSDLEKEIKDLSTTFESATKNVDLYRKLIQNGTLETVGVGLGVTREQALSTASSRQRANLGNVVAKYNEQVSAISNGKGSEYSLGNLNTLSDVDTALQKIAALRKMNGENFSATELGQTTSTIEGLLNQLRETMAQEMGAISGEQFSGKSLEDTIINAINKSKAADFELAQAETAAQQYGTTDQAAIKRNVESTQQGAASIYDAFLNDNRFDSLANSNFGKISLDWSTLEQKFDNMVKSLPDNLRAELERKKIDFKMSVDSYNASIGSLGSFGSAFSAYRNADAIAKKEYDDEVARRDSLQSQLDSGKKADGTALSAEEMVQLQAQIDACNQSLNEMGENGVNLATRLKQVSLANMAASIEKSQKALGDMSGMVLAVVNAAKELASAVNKVYDVMNDGENPAWMQDAEAFLGDFGDMFSQLIAPISAVIGMISALTVAITVCETAAAPLIIITAVLVAAAATIALIVAAIQQHDRELERANENLEKRIEDTKNAITNLNAAAERMTGFEKWNSQLEATGKSLENYHDSLQQMNNEIEKKNTDEDKVKEYRQDAQEALDEFYDGLKDLQDELTSGVESWADSMSDALRSAFQSGENAARAMHSSVKTMIGDMIEEIMKMAILEPLLQNAMNELLGGTYEQIKDKYTDKNGKFDAEGYTAYVKSALTDSKKLDKFEKSAVNAGNVWLETYAAMEEKLKEYLAFNSDTSSLSSGIESITEDTARTLEGLANSQLSVTIQIRQLLEDYMNSMNGGTSSSTIASIQTHVSQINSNVALMLRGMQELRNTSVRPLHVTVV